MAYNNNSNVNELGTKDLKNQLMGMGLYEAGMGIQEMRDLFKTVKQSEQSATEENEYRVTMLNTIKNCDELLELMSESKTDVTYNLRSKDSPKENVTYVDTSDNSNDEILPVHEANVSTVVKDDKINESVESDKSDKTVQSSDLHLDKIESVTKNIDVFSQTEENQQPLKIHGKKSKELQPFYCNPKIVKMPTYFAVKAITKYHELFLSQYQYLQNKTVNLVPWSEGIKINKDVNTDVKEDEETAQNIENKLETSLCLRSRRQIKRKLYTEYNSDDDDLISNKKTKDNSLKTSHDIESHKEDFTIYSSMDKIFDDLKDTGDFNAIRREKRQSKDSCSSDNEPCTTIQVLAMIHNEDKNNDSKTKTLLKNTINDDEYTPMKRKLRSASQSHEKKSITKKLTDNKMDSIFPDDNRIEFLEEDASTPNSAHKRKNMDSLSKWSMGMESESQDDEIFNAIESNSDDSSFMRRRIVPPNPLRDKMSLRSQQKISNLSKKRIRNPNSVAKPENQRSKTDSKSDGDKEIEELFSVSPNKFYPKIDKTPRNKSSTPSKLRVSPIREEEYQCPICDKLFPLSVIEQHASGCVKLDVNEKLENPGTLCCICDAFVLQGIEEHIERCKKTHLIDLK